MRVRPEFSLVILTAKALRLWARAQALELIREDLFNVLLTKDPRQERLSSRLTREQVFLGKDDTTETQFLLPQDSLNLCKKHHDSH